LFELQVTGVYITAGADKSHGRIIWDCAWAAEGDVFATASRDKTVKIWEKGNGGWKPISTIKTSQAATAVAFSPGNGQRRRLAIGLENGEILIYWGLSTSAAEWRLDEKISSRLAHVDHIHRMAWRPSFTNPDELATCSQDGTLRILKHRFRSD
jgi:elongator complex protein 2